MSPSKDVKTFFIIELRCYIAIVSSSLLPTTLTTIDNPVNCYLTSTVNKTRYRPVIAPFSVLIFEMSSAILLAIPEMF